MWRFHLIFSLRLYYLQVKLHSSFTQHEMARREGGGGAGRNWPTPPLVCSSFQCCPPQFLEEALGHRWKLGFGSDSPSITRAPTSSFFTGTGGECEGISCREEVTALAGMLPLHPPHPPWDSLCLGDGDK